MKNSATSKQNRGKWLILLIFILCCAAILPLSWNAIQAQRAQQKTMKALKKAISDITAALKTDNCFSTVIAPARALSAGARSVDGVFPRLSHAPGEFAELSHALVLSSDQFGVQVKIADCQALRLELPEIKKRCDACHELFNPQAKSRGLQNTWGS